VKTIQAYQCSCRKVYATEDEVQECEAIHRRFEESNARWRKDADEKRVQALDLARKSNALRLLVVAGELKAARWVAEELYWDEIDWDANSSWWTEATFDEMVEAAHHAAPEEAS
jgi:hypothetical protein